MSSYGINVVRMKVRTFNDWLRQEKLVCTLEERSAKNWCAFVVDCTISEQRSGGSRRALQKAMAFGQTSALAIEALVHHLGGRTLVYRSPGTTDDPRLIECPPDWDGTGFEGVESHE